MFQNVAVNNGGDSPAGVFSIVGLVSVPTTPTQASQPYRFGLVDEAGKINVNALLELDNGQGVVGYQRPDGPAEHDRRRGQLHPRLARPRRHAAHRRRRRRLLFLPAESAYHCKNGPLDSLEELLLVKGVTPQLLFGNDRNRNGVLDPDEDDGSGQVDLGWSAYLTVYSREPNTDVNGNPRIYLNDPDIDTLADNLTPVLGQDMANYIIAYRLYGQLPRSTAAAGRRGAASPPARRCLSRHPLQRRQRRADPAPDGPLPSSRSGGQQKPQKISSLFDLISSSVSVTERDGPNRQDASRCPARSTTPASCRRLLPLMLDETTTTMNTDLAPRINVNTASETVLERLEAALSGSSPDAQRRGLERSNEPGGPVTDEDVQNILNTRPDPIVERAAGPDLPDAGLAADGGEPAAGQAEGAGAVHHRSQPGLPLSVDRLFPGRRRPGGADRGGHRRATTAGRASSTSAT